MWQRESWQQLAGGVMAAKSSVKAYRLGGGGNLAAYRRQCWRKQSAA
jgi:hypothetical protein